MTKEPIGPVVNVKIVDPKKDYELVKEFTYTMGTQRARDVGRQIVAYLKTGFGVISVPILS